MSQNSKSVSYFPAAIILLVSIIAAIPFMVQTRSVMSIYSFRFNPYALLSMLGLIANVVVVALLFTRQKKTFDSLWLIAGSMAVLVFCIFEVLQRLSANPTLAVFWAQLGGIGVSFASAFYFLFAFNYTNPEKLNAMMTSSVLLGAAVIAFFHANGNLIFKTDPESVFHYAWGYNNKPGLAFIASFLWFALLTTIAIVLVLNYRRRTKNKIIRSQAAIFAAGLAAPLIGGVIFDSVFPMLHISAIPPMGGAFLTITGVLMVVGIWKYRVFELSPTILSQNILTTMSEAVVVTNNDLEIEYVNTEAEKLFDKDSTVLYTSKVSDVLSNSHRLKTLRDNTINGDTFNTIEPIEDMTIGDGHDKRYLRILASPISRNNQIEGFIFAISDITQLQHAYFELEAAKTGVEQIVQERTHELRQAQDKLLETDKLKTEFIMLASHNLRTPLAIIEGYVDLLGRSNLDGTQKLAQSNLYASTRRLSNMIDDLLIISSLESGNLVMDRKPIKAAELLERIFREAELLAKSSSNNFTADIEIGDVQIMASPDRLRAAINNIVDNAFKFTKEGKVTCEAKVDNESLIITVQDTGVGINAEEIPKLFTKFHRGGDTLQFQYEGKGLGLYLAKLIVNEHEGTIDIESVEDEGTTVTIAIPIAAQTEEQTESESNKENEQAKD